MISRQELQGHWNELHGQIKERWGELSDDELEKARGNADQLVGVIQQKTGESRSEVEDFLEQALEKSASTVEQFAEKAREYTDEAIAASRKQYEQVAENVKAGYEQAEGVVRQNPFESVAVAFGAGLVSGVIVGLILKSR